jgi:hypothetical protein
MALQEVNSDAVKTTVRTMLQFLERDDVMAPTSLSEQISSGKTLLRALLTGQLVLAQPEQQPAAAIPDANPEAEEAA